MQYNSPLSVKNLNPTIRAAFANAQLWFTKQLDQYVLSVLASTDDPSAPGTKVLDNTLIYWMSEVGDGAMHTTTSDSKIYRATSYLPLVSIGKCGGAIKSGQVVRFDTDRSAVDLYLSFAKAMGATSATFAGAQPVSEVLV